MNRLIKVFLIVVGLTCFSLSVNAQTSFKQSSHGMSLMDMWGGFHFYGSTTGRFEVILNKDFMTIGFSDGTMIALNAQEKYMASYDNRTDDLKIAEIDQNEAIYLSPEARLILEEFQDHQNELGSLIGNCPWGQVCGPIEIHSAAETPANRFMRTQFQNTPSNAFCDSVRNDLNTPYAGHSTLLGCTAGGRMGVILSGVATALSCGTAAASGGLAGPVCVAAFFSLFESAVSLMDADQQCKLSYTKTQQDAEACAEEFKESRNNNGYKDMFSEVSGGVNISAIRHNKLLECIKSGNVTITDLNKQATSNNTSAECNKGD
ncbi:hypothetical protein [Idiomarina sp.]|uniref:hypothetical protein n=1 Tax=Idiomarina sp. TaxID=1874361 RepID=UPI0025C01718|nr:hypothetical protein [Idiomarina sp.]NQZ04717.1 hypothetical protein [Idiomarina sp.]